MLVSADRALIDAVRDTGISIAGATVSTFNLQMTDLQAAVARASVAVAQFIASANHFLRAMPLRMALWPRKHLRWIRAVHYRAVLRVAGPWRD